MKYISICSLVMFFTVAVNFCLAANNDGKQKIIYLASVDIVDNKTDYKGNEQEVHTTTNTSIKPKFKRVEISGYIDSKYVYLIADIENGRYMTGNMIKNGKSTYVNGEYVNGILYLYDTQGKQYMLINDAIGLQLSK